jgi:hypothetical protein
MIKQLDPARKGIVFGCMTPEEQQFLKDAAIAGAIIDLMRLDGSWRIIHYPSFDKNGAYWTDWTRPEEPKHPLQPTNLPDGWKAYRVVWRVGGWLDTTYTESEVAACPIGMVLDARVLCCWLVGDDWLISSKRMPDPCDEVDNANWAIFRPIEVTK